MPHATTRPGAKPGPEPTELSWLSSIHPLVVVIARTSQPGRAHFYLSFLERIAAQDERRMPYRPNPRDGSVEIGKGIYTPIVDPIFRFVLNTHGAIAVNELVINLDSIDVELKALYSHRISDYVAKLVEIIRRTSGRKLEIFLVKEHWDSVDLAAIVHAVSSPPAEEPLTEVETLGVLKSVLFELEHPSS